MKLALPTGSLEVKTLELFKEAGFRIERDGRSYRAETQGHLIDEILFTRPQAIPRLIDKGICHVGICGKDCVLESGIEWSYIDKKREREWYEPIQRYSPQILIVCELKYSAKSFKPAKVVLIGERELKLPRKRLKDPRLSFNFYGAKIYSEYPQWTKRFFGDAVVIASQGSTEAHVPSEFPLGICVAETGKTIEQNSLSVLSVLFESPVVLVTSGSFWRSYPDGVGRIAINALRKLLVKALAEMLKTDTSKRGKQ